MDRRNSGPVARLLRQYSTALDDGRNGARDHEQVFTDPVQLARAVATKPNLDAVGGCDGGSYQLGAIPPVRALAQHSEATRSRFGEWPPITRAHGDRWKFWTREQASATIAIIDLHCVEKRIEASPDRRDFARRRVRRSEEHTSELQSLMRISSAVFCWKK